MVMNTVHVPEMHTTCTCDLNDLDLLRKTIMIQCVLVQNITWFRDVISGCHGAILSTESC